MGGLQISLTRSPDSIPETDLAARACGQRRAMCRIERCVDQPRAHYGASHRQPAQQQLPLAMLLQRQQAPCRARRNRLPRASQTRSSSPPPPDADRTSRRRNSTTGTIQAKTSTLAASAALAPITSADSRPASTIAPTASAILTLRCATSRPPASSPPIATAQAADECPGLNAVRHPCNLDDRRAGRESNRSKAPVERSAHDGGDGEHRREAESPRVGPSRCSALGRQRSQQAPQRRRTRLGATPRRVDRRCVNAERSANATRLSSSRHRWERSASRHTRRL